MKNGVATLVLAIFDCVLAGAAIAQVTENRLVATYTAPRASAGAGIDYASAKPLRMPLANVPPISQSRAISTAPDPRMLFGNPQVSPGSVGSGKEDPIPLAPPKNFQQQDAVIPEEFGTANLPYTTSRVNAVDHLTVKFSPFRAAGKLFFKKGTAALTCSASLIKRGLVVTAAHCVANYGKKEFYSNWEFVPAYDNGTAPYGRWSVESAKVLTLYLDGTDGCEQFGVVCPDDVAILTLRPQGGAFAGAATGWFAYEINGVGFTSSGQALISELGYPTLLDKGELMERTDAQGTMVLGLSKNTVIGSLMNQDGSSGGPWLVNLGVAPALSGGVLFGSGAVHNVVVGVASWTSTDKFRKEQGASPFTTLNIQTLVDEACAATPAACAK
jgi:hypothetical protein